MLHGKITFCAVVLLAALVRPAAAQENGQAEEPSAAVPSNGLTGGDWSPNVDQSATAAKAAPGAEIAPDEAQKALVGKVNAYFNAIGDLRGNFQQTDEEQKVTKGKFYIQRPGRFRFVYASPSKLQIVSDGEYLAFEDKEVKSYDRYPIESTPFRMLLEKNVDLVRSAKITEIYEGDDLVTMTLVDREDDSSGQIRLFFAKTPEGTLELSEWVVTGPQGADTRVQVADLVRGEKVKVDFFKLSEIDLTQTQGRK